MGGRGLGGAWTLVLSRLSAHYILFRILTDQCLRGARSDRAPLERVELAGSVGGGHFQRTSCHDTRVQSKIAPQI